MLKKSDQVLVSLVQQRYWTERPDCFRSSSLLTVKFTATTNSKTQQNVRTPGGKKEWWHHNMSVRVFIHAEGVVIATGLIIFSLENYFGARPSGFIRWHHSGRILQKNPTVSSLVSGYPKGVIMGWPNTVPHFVAQCEICKKDFFFFVQAIFSHRRH